ncbi:MAG: polysaccharide deacetylase family protein [Ardenticatenales bacterium]
MTAHPPSPTPLRTSAAITTAALLALFARGPAAPPAPSAPAAPIHRSTFAPRADARHVDPPRANALAADPSRVDPPRTGAVLPPPGTAELQLGPDDAQVVIATTPTQLRHPIPPDPDHIRRAHVPILLYHHVSAATPSTSALHETTVSPAALDTHLTVLAAGGWTVVPLDAVVDALALGTPLPAKPVVLTFDDGWRDQLDIALPILIRHGVTATFFLTTEPIESGWVGSLSWEGVDELSRAGMTIGAHTRTHRDLRGLSDAALADELAVSADVIAAHTGARPRLLAYPYGGVDERVERAAVAAGYVAAVTANPDGFAAGERLLALPRVAVRGWCDTEAAFVGCVGAWLGGAD